jgi:cyanophycin synthetase
MAGHCPGEVIFFARDASNPVLAEHRQKGGRAAFVREGSIILARGREEEVLVSVDRVPLTHQGRVAFQVENVLAAVAAVWSLALPPDVVRDGLASFTPDVRQLPARFNVLRAAQATVIVDYAHNPSALAALVDALAHFPAERRTLVFSGCDRRDADIVQMGKIVGNGFDRVILYQDQGNDNRADGELNALLRRGLAGSNRVSEIVETANEREAIARGLQTVRPNEVLVLGVEAIEEALEFLERSVVSGQESGVGGDEGARNDKSRATDH